MPAEEDRVVTDSSPPVPKIHGFENEIKSLKHFLLDQKVNKEFKSLVIVGEYGVGKTALCKMIFNDKDVTSVYAPRIWVSMDRKKGQNNNPEKERLHGKIYVLKKILTALGVEDSILETIRRDANNEVKENQENASNQKAGEIDRDTADEKELSALLYALHLSLRWKKYLIVFDDVREEDHWDEILQNDEEKLKKEKKWGKYLSDGFPKGSGGRVIYTTRNEDEKDTLAKKLVAEEHEIHRLWPLTDTGSVWNIYEEALIKNGEKPPRNDKKCIDELMNKSRGLPLAASLLAELLPVFIDDEKTEENGSGTPESDSNTTPEENAAIPAQQA
ncbi:PREDICTED: probable disease resistance protein At5g45490 isoform X2 [Camelina sativa]|uniref:Probable disease resistance protein At5g45490 isoform X1 n=1 Tax=Camelina sativa TaxID=90675 RepID=A0ABM0X6R7_CAMSA|nr:PREDICTED: probable disease resistance protein At5g45490 isoform X1 [Camelina sativa]XP_019095708.1 PREDICTED: probable disease resistance protein At5g45490 isoform X2 [Camelina sativa]